VADAEGRGLGTNGGSPRDTGHADERGEDLANALRDGLGSRWGASAIQFGELHHRPLRTWPAGPDQPQHDWEPPRTITFGAFTLPELSMGGHADEFPSRLVRAAGGDAGEDPSRRRRRVEKIARAENKQALRCYGNAVAPAVAEVIGRAVLEVARRRVI
jgi:hypothetical protein